MTIQFIQAKNYSVGRGGSTPRMIVLHTMETPETEGRAFQVATWFGSSSAPQASAHYCVDDGTSVYQCVKDADTAWAVDDFALNEQSISIELSGTAKQTVVEWHDKYSSAELTHLEDLVKSLMKEYGIQALHLSPKQILDGKSKGIIYHADITSAKKIVGGHTDPGSNFPLTEFLKAVS